ncbi:MAG: hypothetical protein Q7J54_06180 [Candidatus Woesearchaeota archaeon]|nr:hypothetical protein [Candidatus Woesearchaeota archaeon]
MYEILYSIALIVLGTALAYLIKVFMEKYVKKKFYKWSKNRISFAAKNLGDFLNLLKMVLMVFVFLVFLSYGLGQIKENSFILSLSGYMIYLLPKLFAITLIFLTGIILARIIGKAIENFNYNYSYLASFFVQAIIIIATILTVLEYVEIKTTAFFEIFRVLLYTIGLTIAISFGIAIGFAMKDEINKVFKKKKK